LRKPAAVALVLLLAGFLNIARGLDHPGGDYRPWALHHASYSDLLALGGDRYLAGDHPVPYVDDRIEYPVVLGFLLWLPSFAPGGQFGFFLLSSLFLAACLLAALAALRRIPGTNVWLLAAAPALATYGLLNWDLVGIALLLGALALDRGSLLGLGVATKLFPAAGLPALAGRKWVPAAAVAIAVNLPLAIVARDNWWWFFRFNSRRPPDFSIWNALHVTSVGVVNVLSLGVVAVAMLLALRAPSRLHGVAFVIAVWMTVNKVSSPQYSLWVFAAAALVSAPWRIWWALVLASMFDFVCELWLYSRHSLTLSSVVLVMVVVRTAATAWFAWWCWRRLTATPPATATARRADQPRFAT